MKGVTQIWRENSPDVVGGGVVFVVDGALVVVGVITGGRLDFVYVAWNPLEVKLLSDLKRTTIVLRLDSTGFGTVPPQNLPEGKTLC